MESCIVGRCIELVGSQRSPRRRVLLGSVYGFYLCAENLIRSIVSGRTGSSRGLLMLNCRGIVPTGCPNPPNFRVNLFLCSCSLKI